SVGALRGPLDTQRYIRSRTRPESPRRYPVRVVHRRFDTDENVLTTYAVMHLDRDLAAAPVHLLPTNAPERREIERGRSTVIGWLRHPALSESTARARDVHRRRDLLRLVDRAQARVESGRVAAPARYRDLIDWMKARAAADAGATAGDIAWAFYDERFDTKLFEIWSLARLTVALEAVLGVPTDAAASLFERASRAIRSWDFGSVRVDLHYQPALAKLTDQPTTWRYKEPNDAALSGFPDIAVSVRPAVGERFAVLIDPKLRQRKAAPTEELYKLLGYFGNLPEQTPRGAIIFYAPGAPRVYRLEGSTPDAQLLAVGIDPADDASIVAGFARLAEMVTTAADVSPAVVAAVAAAAAGDAESVAAGRQKFKVDAMLAAAQKIPAGELMPTKKATEATLGEHWPRLGTSAQQMLVTAEYFGTHAPAEADHSGPLLGLAAACEATLFDYLIEAANAADPTRINAGATFGQMIRWVNDSTYPNTRTAEGEYLRGFLIANQPWLDLPAVRVLIPKLRELNSTYRIPAAHREVVPQPLWASGRNLVFDSHTGVLARLVSVCAPPAPA
ncbi:MAG: hypothetical protein AB7Q27_24590, partial [Acidimicrobiia bacterium]